MRSRLNFGMSMAFDFDYYLMDEVAAVGDAQFKQKSKALLQEKIGKSNVIMVTHAMEEVARLCNVVVLVQEGHAILYEDVREGIEAYQRTAGGPARKGRQAQRAGRARGEAALARQQLIAERLARRRGIDAAK